jgi:hypothetical protein
MPRRIAIDTPLDCTICAVGTLDERWADRVGGLRVRAAGRGCPVTELSGRLLDQAALFGVLVTLYNLGLPLLTVDCRAVQESPGEAPASPAGRARPGARGVGEGKVP